MAAKAPERPPPMMIIFNLIAATLGYGYYYSLGHALNVKNS
jgi:hypothetical protein